MLFAISVFVASVLLGLLLAYLFQQYIQRKNKYAQGPPKANPSRRSTKKNKKK
jgi:hypothetical protein